MSITKRPGTSPAPPLRAVLYLRQSVEKEESISLENQEHAAREYCRQRGYAVVVSLSEQVSGRSWLKRTQAQQAVSWIEEGRADVVVVWRWSRFARNRRDWAVAVDRVEAAGGRLESAVEPLDTSTAGGRFARGMMAEHAAFQSELIGETWRETHENRRRRGLPHSGGPRYGYDLIDGQYEHNPIEAPRLQAMYEHYLSGHGLTHTAHWANRQGWTTRGGRTWTRTTMTFVLDSGFGAGVLIERATVAGKRKHDITLAAFHPGAHTALIDDDQWAEYQRRRAETRSAPARARTDMMLSGLVRCGECGSPMHNGWNKNGDYYRCGRAMGSGVGRKLSMTRRLVEQAVMEWVIALPVDLDAIAAAEASQKRSAEPIEDSAAIDRLLQRNEERLVALTVRNLDGRIPDAAYAATSRQLEAERDSLNERRTQAVSRRPKRDLLKVLPALSEGFPLLPPSEQNIILKAIIARVIIGAPVRQGCGVWQDRVHIIPLWSPEA